MSFAKTQRAEAFAAKSVLTGNPVRDRVRAVADTAYPELTADGPLRLVVFGGSQGARAFADLVPPAIAELPEVMRHRLRIVQQCRPEDLDRVAEAYRQAKVNVELQPFFADLPERMANAHLVIGRAGASTVAELTVLGRPAILVPLPNSMDNHQYVNAETFEDAGGGWVMMQDGFTAPAVEGEVRKLLDSSAARDEMKAGLAEVRAKLGQGGAIERAADVFAGML